MDLLLPISIPGLDWISGVLLCPLPLSLLCGILELFLQKWRDLPLSLLGVYSKKINLEAPHGFYLFTVEVTWDQTNCWLSVAEIRADP